MEILRTPDGCFADLPGYDFEPHYLELPETGGLRMHYVDEGQGDETVLLMHGEPSWSYLYRKMIPVFKDAGYRVVAPDLIGFGKSDKPANVDDYTYQSHMDWVTAWLRGLDLKNITMFCQDWGGLLGLRMAAENEERFARIAAGNTFLPTGDQAPGKDFQDWLHFSQNAKRLPVGRIIKNGCVSDMTKEIVAAYEAPYPEEKYKAGARKFPALVPITPDNPASDANRAAWEVLKKWEKPFLTTFSDSDPITKGGQVLFRRAVPGTKKQPHVIIKEAGHFLQEDKGEEIARVVVDWMKG